MDAFGTPLTRALWYRHYVHTIALLKGGVDPDEPDGMSNRPIDYAVFTEELVCFGADVNLVKLGAANQFFLLESGMSLAGAPQKIFEERHAVFCSVLSIVGVHKGLALRVVEWALKC